MNMNAILMLPVGFIMNSFNDGNLLGRQVKSCVCDSEMMLQLFYGSLQPYPHIFIFNHNAFTFRTSCLNEVRNAHGTKFLYKEICWVEYIIT